MSANAPQTLSVKRKRGDAPVEALMVAAKPEKRLKSGSFSLKRKLDLPANEQTKRTKDNTVEGTIVWRLVTSSKAQYETGVQAGAPPTPTRQFHVSRKEGNVVLFERRVQEAQQAQLSGQKTSAEVASNTPATTRTEQPSTPRKRPGAASAIHRKPAPAAQASEPGISEQTLRAFEKFSQEVENNETPKRSPRRKSSITSPSRFTPKPPRHRYAERHPEQATPHIVDPDAMDVDSEGYVYDTYVREIIMPDADGKVPEPQGNIGYIVLTEEDEEWWYEEGDTDKEFGTDDEDENAEDYYANDYPEDELSEDDEFDRQPYRHYRGESEEEYDLEEGSGDEEGEGGERMFAQTVPRVKGVYWGKVGE